MQGVESLFFSWLPAIITVVFFAFFLSAANWLLFKRNVQNTQHNMFGRQLIMLLLMLISVVALVIALPLNDTTESQVLSLIGLVLSGLLAFSSTNIVSNLVAGAMMRFTQPFKTGDYIRVADMAGKVTERGLFDCEIQTENRELIAIPNNLMINHPITSVRSSGTIISVSLSLGYDVHHSRIETLLKEAANQIGLQDPFVHVTELGNFAVTYKISGLLLEVKNLLTMRSKLHCQILDCLHDNNIEIMSPSFMNQRKLPDEQLVLAKSPLKPAHQQRADEQTVAEDIVFDKAEEAQQAEQQEHALAEQLVALKVQIDQAEGKTKAQLEARFKQLEISLKQHSEIRKNMAKVD